MSLYFFSCILFAITDLFIPFTVLRGTEFVVFDCIFFGGGAGEAVWEIP